MALDIVQNFTVKGMMENFQKLIGTYFQALFAMPNLIIDYYLLLYHSFIALFKYHVFTVAARPLTNELVMVLGSDSLLGRAFASQAVKMNASVVCLDANKEKGDAFVKSINDAARDPKATFFECDLNKMENLSNVLDTIQKDLGDVTVLVNCSTNNVVASYYTTFKKMVPMMKGKAKGRFVFIRSLDAETRNAVESLYSSVNKEIKALNKEDVYACLAHVYAKISDGSESNKIFGHINHDDAAKTILEGVSKRQKDIYVPGYMVFFTWYYKFIPSAFVNMWEDFFFGD